MDDRGEERRRRARRRAAEGIAEVVLAVVGIGVVTNLLLPEIDLPSVPVPDLPDLPDLPDWLATVLWWGKFVVIAVLVLAAVAEGRRDRQRDP